MTLVVGYDTPHGILLVADRQATEVMSGWKETRKDSKIINLDCGLTIGYAGSYVVGQVLRFLPIPSYMEFLEISAKNSAEKNLPKKSADELLWEFCVKHLVPELRDNMPESEDEWDVIVCSQTAMVRVDSTYATALVESQWLTIGTGCEFAAGYLTARNINRNSVTECVDLLVDTVRQASERNVYVGAELDVVWISTNDNWPTTGGAVEHNELCRCITCSINKSLESQQ